MFRLTSLIEFWGWKEGEQLWTNWAGKLLTLDGVGLVDVWAEVARPRAFPECIEEHRRTLWGFESIGSRKSKLFFSPNRVKFVYWTSYMQLARKAGGGSFSESKFAKTSLYRPWLFYSWNYSGEWGILIRFRLQRNSHIFSFSLTSSLCPSSFPISSN